ncbi:MAG: glycosyltransferase [Treponema sp.]|nr:glycosyltransferase [Treponema sp.]
MKKTDIGVVLVTYNRLGELKRSLACYEGQTAAPAYIIVVDNCSTDGTAEYLAEWAGRERPFPAEAVRLPENTGGSGGFHAGLAAALGRDAPWVWASDDDGFPEPDCLERAQEFIDGLGEGARDVSAFCGMCVDGGRPTPVQRARIVRRLLVRQEAPVPEKEYASGRPFAIDLYSFVGTVLKKEALMRAGLPRKDFFIYQDDYEHALRMGKEGKIYCVPGIVIRHRDNYGGSRRASWRDYYATRNAVVMYREHFGGASLAVRIARRLLAALASLNPAKVRVTLEAISDGLKGRTGVHGVYVPGWEG